MVSVSSAAPTGTTTAPAVSGSGASVAGAFFFLPLPFFGFFVPTRCSSRSRPGASHSIATSNMGPRGASASAVGSSRNGLPDSSLRLKKSSPWKISPTSTLSTPPGSAAAWTSASGPLRNRSSNDVSSRASPPASARRNLIGQPRAPSSTSGGASQPESTLQPPGRAPGSASVIELPSMGASVGASRSVWQASAQVSVAVRPASWSLSRRVPASSRTTRQR
mmetsp:Transcript_23850/g.67093  ORF Transcript_23850/g.67093 Transcript_23850/m.67093 type:complete len:221 (-) Transcript_23850:3561-4223(-)